MGQKVNPHGARVGVILDWSTKWYAGKKDFSNNLVEDFNLRKMLKEKLYAALSRAIAARPNDRHLRSQLYRLSGARICTIHSFCYELIRRNFASLGLSPKVRVADSAECAILSKRCITETLEHFYETGGDDFFALLGNFDSEKSDEPFVKLLLSCYDRIRAYPDYLGFLDQVAAGLEDERDRAAQNGVFATAAGRIVRQESARILERTLEKARALLDFVSTVAVSERNIAPIEALADGLETLSGALEQGYDAFRDALGGFAPPRLYTLQMDVDAAELLKKGKTEIVDSVRKLQKDCYALPEADAAADFAATARLFRPLVGVLRDYDARFSAAKRERRLVDFSDLEHLTARLLAERHEEGYVRTPLCRKLQDAFDEICIDEYQDVNRLQDLIFSSVSKADNRFMVGDVKQSIYRFRLADPTIFLEKYEKYADAPQPEGVPRRVFLRESFRSRPEVVDAVNAVFGCLMSKGLGELDYDERAALRAGLEHPGVVPVPELVLVPTPGAEEGEERPDKTAVEAAQAARMMRRLVEGGARVMDGGSPRPLGYGDIAVLLRSVNVSGPAWRRALSREGVPVEAGSSGGFFESAEVSVMLSLLALIDNPRQDVALVSVLSSALFGFSADELTRIRLRRPEGDLYAALRSCAGEDAKVRDFLERLDGLRDLARDAELAELLREVCGRLDCFAVCAAMPEGEARRARLQRLFELARDFEKRGWRGLHRFLDWTASMRSRGEEPAFPEEGGSGAVRIMSIHRSKGLEFPVVFIGGTARSFNLADTRESVLMHPQLGLGPKLTDAARGIEYPTLARRAVARRLERELLSEELRLLYVAMTRARERLFITCALPDPEARIEKLAPGASARMPAQALLAMRCAADWLISAALGTGCRALNLSIAAPDGELDRVEVKNTRPQAAEPETGPEEESPAVPDLAARLDWIYPHRGAERLPSKLTATELKSLDGPDEEAAPLLPRTARRFRKPELEGAGRRLDAAERGTAAHLALRYLDLGRIGSAAEARAELDRLAAEGRLSPLEAGAVDAAALARFAASEIGRKIASSPRVLREFPFALLCGAERFFAGAEGEELLLQGVVDCCLFEPDGLVIVDYKTDRISAAEAPERAGRYASQLESYAWAMSQITGRSVKAKLVYFLRPGEAVEL